MTSPTDTCTTCGVKTPPPPVMTPGLVGGLVEDSCGQLHAPVLKRTSPEGLHAWRDQRIDLVYPSRVASLGWPEDPFQRKITAAVNVDRLVEFHPHLFRVRVSMLFIDIDGRGAFDSERYHDRLHHDRDVAVAQAEQVSQHLATLAFETGEGREVYRYDDAVAFEQREQVAS